MSAEERMAVQAKQGRAIFGIDLKIVGDDGKELPRDGKASGELMVRGPWVISNYFKSDGRRSTGGRLVSDRRRRARSTRTDTCRSPIAARTSSNPAANGLVRSTSRTSRWRIPRWRWPPCIGVKHPKWDERPLLVVVKKPNAELTGQELLAFFEGKIAKWWTPDDVVFVDAIPLGATGKMLKNKLREQFADYKLPTA